ncbi:TIGR01777 family oxidoreductase [Streptomyces sp. NBC_01754]|uniref:TIGR01777 family oxidoreductase n=1 Tax=Streptomyces sp. NBC_01754 TaxID=2975930 RepID=UPI002DDB2F9C|nr:TIGR01777 family oxidoreductase [Streptomyces sp. NBC_01754]WSC92105.1 TIGR01777 family oxidoreductase [Streptomyces sp. NBC_01754]
MLRSRIAVSGSSGLIGAALVHSLRADGHEVVRLVRRPAAAGDEVEWDPGRQYVDAAGLVGCDAVVHLAGAGVGDHRWTEGYKREIRDSRVLGTRAIAEAAASLDTPPKVLLSGSAIGYYGDTGDRSVDEAAPPGDGFLPSVCVEWEGATAAAEEAGIRTVHARTGLVVARGGGAWGRLFPLFKAGLGGRLGNGRQYWSFIALHDHIAALRHILDTGSLSGPVNLTGPAPVTNGQVTAAMGRVLHRPTLFTAPAPALRIALGEFAGDVLGSQRVLPGRLLDSGFSFAFPDIDAAIRSALR